MNRFFLITGCSGGGKSTLLAALADAGHATIPEPGRRIVEAEQARGGTVLPWVDMSAFAKAAVEMAHADLREAAAQVGPVFFDRGLIDAAVALDHSGGPPFSETLGRTRVYCDPVFVTPPWPEIYQTDAERRHGLEDAKAEYHRLTNALAQLGYRTHLLPKVPVASRIREVLAHLPRNAGGPLSGG